MNFRSRTPQHQFYFSPTFLLLIERNGQLHTSFYDKRDDFNFYITNFLFLSSYIPSLQVYDVLSLSLFDTPGFAPRINVLFGGPGKFPVIYSNRDTSWNAWNRPSGSLMIDTGSYSTIWSLPLTNVKWHSDPWPGTVTSPPIILSTNFMILISNLTFTELQVVSKERLQRVWHASMERLPFRTPDSVPFFFFLIFLCSNCWDQFFPTFSTFHLGYPSAFPWWFLPFLYRNIICCTIAYRFYDYLKLPQLTVLSGPQSLCHRIFCGVFVCHFAVEILLWL